MALSGEAVGNMLLAVFDTGNGQRMASVHELEGIMLIVACPGGAMMMLRTIVYWDGLPHMTSCFSVCRVHTIS